MARLPEAPRYLVWVLVAVYCIHYSSSEIRMPCPSIQRDYYPIKPQNSPAPYFLNITEDGSAVFDGMCRLHYGPSSQTYTSKGLPLVDDLKFVHFSRNLTQWLNERTKYELLHDFQRVIPFLIFKCTSAVIDHWFKRKLALFLASNNILLKNGNLPDHIGALCVTGRLVRLQLLSSLRNDHRWFSTRTFQICIFNKQKKRVLHAVYPPHVCFSFWHISLPSSARSAARNLNFEWGWG